MGFLKKFFRNVFHEGATHADPTSSFDQLTDDQLEAHLGINQYGQFQLTDAVRPSYDLKVHPKQGYRHDLYIDEENNSRVPVLMASASKDQLFELFMDMIQPLGQTVDVVLETSHDPSEEGHTDLYREHIDMPVLRSILYEYEDLLLNDGCTGIAVLNPNTPQEVQFDEHKLLIVYGSPLETFEHRLERNGVGHEEDIRFITEAEHVHSSSEEYQQQFQELCRRLGMDEKY
ncbi:MAG: hypothetical protein VXY07_03340 [Planctomycetota bacterium]|mgnify:FL=1|nr:hypothetical protein [Planctomycetota bacterium]MEC9187599.1 hypothetical protein [Planctomycetota bacterium]